ncbi:hypothetical protein 2200_scaffold2278_00041 [Bacteriophage sp.]|nr:hypothetical protein 2200_scaffold2278_00041 [Bacteriophage sp.]
MCGRSRTPSSPTTSSPSRTSRSSSPIWRTAATSSSRTSGPRPTMPTAATPSSSSRRRASTLWKARGTTRASMSKKERRRTRISSTIDKLPDDIKTELDVRLADTANTYEELSAWLKTEGYEISKSAIGRYAIRSTQAAQRVAETLQRTQAIAQAVEAHPDLDYTKAASMVLMDGLMQRVSTAEGDFQEMPLDKAGRLIASLARNATYEKRVRQDMKKKAELAFDQLEAELMAAIKQHPELAEELHDVLSRAREKVLDDGED